MPRGRVRVLDDAKQREICAILSAGCSLQAAAQFVGCAPNTIHREAARNADFGQQFREARLRAQLSPLQAMRKAASSHWRAAAWMLERADPDHFGRRPAPAFRPKQAQTLKDDILGILSAEIENPFLLRRLKKQIKHLMDYSIDGVVGVERPNHQLRDVLRQINEIDREAEASGEAAFDEMKFRERNGRPHRQPPSSPSKTSPTKTSPSKTSPTATSPSPSSKKSSSATSSSATSSAARPSNPGKHGPGDLDPDLANTPVTWGDMTKVFQQISKGTVNGNGTPAANPVAPSPDAPPTEKSARSSTPAP